MKLKIWQKIMIVMIGGALSWGLAYCSSIWPTWAIVLASLSTASTATVGIMTGFIPTTT
jgi:hypothetical protein